MSLNFKTLKGETIIEVLVAISIFSVVAITTVTTMNKAMSTAQTSLELTMARNEIDAQAEALRFIHNSYVSDRDYGIDNQEFSKLWENIERVSIYNPISFNHDNCQSAIDAVKDQQNIFVVNTRILSERPEKSALETNNKIINFKDTNILTVAPVYPRIIYKPAISASNNESSDERFVENSGSNTTEMPAPYSLVSKVEGLWVQGVAHYNGTSKAPEFFDFHIRACWHSSGSSVPNTIGTILRLYNPRYGEKGKTHEN